MTIAKRLIILVAMPLVVLVGLGVFSRMQMAKVESHVRHAASTQVQSLAALGNISLDQVTTALHKGRGLMTIYFLMGRRV